MAIVHDYLTQRGGAERVVLAMLRAFPGAPLHTSLYDPRGTFPEFGEADVRPSALNRLRPLRANHRLALPVLAPTFRRLVVDADIVLCSSSGWAHGVRSRGRKVVYCYTPARWLYQTDRYLPSGSLLARSSLRLLRSPLIRWDRRAAATAHAYLTPSTAVQARIREAYGVEAAVVPAPFTLDPLGPRRAVPGLAPGYLLCVSRLLPYKNVGTIVDAIRDLPGERLVVVGSGPLGPRLEALAPPNVHFLGQVGDETLRWLYEHADALVAASHEDFGLTTLEAAAFGKPSAVLRWGGFLDTVVEHRTGVFFDEPSAPAIRSALRTLRARRFDAAAIRAHAAQYSEDAFIARLRGLVAGLSAAPA